MSREGELWLSLTTRTMLDPAAKKKIIKKFAQGDTDTGSAPVQIALFTEQIKRLTDHLKTHPKDNSSRRGLLKLVSKRKRLLTFLEREDKKIFGEVTKKLKLKK